MSRTGCGVNRQIFGLRNRRAVLSDVLHVEGEVVELIPSRNKPQGIAKIKWTAYNQRGEAVYTFTPIGIVPRRPNPAS
jgi:acyl dehydratase